MSKSQITKGSRVSFLYLAMGRLDGRWVVFGRRERFTGTVTSVTEDWVYVKSDPGQHGLAHPGTRRSSRYRLRVGSDQVKLLGPTWRS